MRETPLAPEPLFRPIPDENRNAYFLEKTSNLPALPDGGAGLAHACHVPDCVEPRTIKCG